MASPKAAATRLVRSPSAGDPHRRAGPGRGPRARGMICASSVRKNAPSKVTAARAASGPRPRPPRRTGATGRSASKPKARQLASRSGTPLPEAQDEAPAAHLVQGRRPSWPAAPGCGTRCRRRTARSRSGSSPRRAPSGSSSIPRSRSAAGPAGRAGGGPGPTACRRPSPPRRGRAAASPATWRSRRPRSGQVGRLRPISRRLGVGHSIHLTSGPRGRGVGSATARRRPRRPRPRRAPQGPSTWPRAGQDLHRVQVVEQREGWRNAASGQSVPRISST